MTSEKEITDAIEEVSTVAFGQEIEDKVFQSIALQCLAKIEGVSLIEGNIIDHLFGRSSSERIRGITIQQDSKSRALNVRVEINAEYGVMLPQKAEEIQQKIAEEMKTLTGLGVSGVHVVFKNLVVPQKELAKKSTAIDFDDVPELHEEAAELEAEEELVLTKD
jgi:uncharacterized alkaline shock family protein YloU